MFVYVRYYTEKIFPHNKKIISVESSFIYSNTNFNMQKVKKIKRIG